MEICVHTPIYHGVTNIFRKDEAVGAVDVWRCTRCGEFFCEEKRWGLTEVTPLVGFPKKQQGTKWSVLVCLAADAFKWTLVETRPGVKMEHNCIDDSPFPLVVNDDYSVSPLDDQTPCEHYLYVVDGFVNKTIRV